MTKQVLSLKDKLEKLEKQKQFLIEQRKKELLKIIEASGALAIDDRVLAGALLFLSDEKNKNHPIIEEFKSYNFGNKKTTRSKSKTTNAKIKEKNSKNNE